MSSIRQLNQDIEQLKGQIDQDKRQADDMNRRAARSILGGPAKMLYDKHQANKFADQVTQLQRQLGAKVSERDGLQRRIDDMQREYDRLKSDSEQRLSQLERDINELRG